VRLNSANRAFAGIVVVAAVVFGVFAATACWIFTMVVYKVATDGVSALTQLGSVAALLLIVLLVATNALALRSFRAQAVPRLQLRPAQGGPRPQPAGLTLLLTCTLGAAWSLRRRSGAGR
jgi:hypothetical protein